jgi:hypothetical protein
MLFIPLFVTLCVKLDLGTYKGMHSVLIQKLGVTISKPMTELLERDKKFEWTPACEASFQELKKRLVTTSILVMPDMEKSFSIYCDAFGQGLVWALMQDGHVVAYAS